MHKVKFKKWNCEIEFGRYGNGNIAMELIDENDGEPIAIATVNIPGEEIPDGHVVIKDYSENEGMLDALIQQKIVSEPIKFIGNINAPVCKLLISEN